MAQVTEHKRKLQGGRTTTVNAHNRNKARRLYGVICEGNERRVVPWKQAIAYANANGWNRVQMGEELTLRGNEGYITCGIMASGNPCGLTMEHATALL